MPTSRQETRHQPHMLSTENRSPQHDWRPTPPRELPQERHADLGLTDTDRMAGDDDA